MKFIGVTYLLILLVAVYAAPTKYNHESETRAGNYEGDLMLEARQVDAIRNGRHPVVSEVDKWVNNVVPYVVEIGPLTNYHVQLIKQAMAKIEEVSSVQFVPHRYQLDFLVISGQPIGCWSTLGSNRNHQNRMNLAPTECFSEGAILHQLMHVLGFGHATNAADRDFHVDIAWDNVRSEHTESLQVYPGLAVPDYGIPFDVDSIMNFGPTHFGRNGATTISVKHGNHTIGQRQKLSTKDIRKLNEMYHCGWC